MRIVVINQQWLNFTLNFCTRACRLWQAGTVDQAIDDNWRNSIQLHPLGFWNKYFIPRVTDYILVSGGSSRDGSRIETIIIVQFTFMLNIFCMSESNLPFHHLQLVLYLQSLWCFSNQRTSLRLMDYVSTNSRVNNSCQMPMFTFNIESFIGYCFVTSMINVTINVTKRTNK